MPRMTPEERDYRRELMRHMHQCHGNFRAEQGDVLSVQELEDIHNMMHRDGYACPPHEHKKPGPYDLGKIKLTFGKGYVDMLKGAVREL